MLEIKNVSIQVEGRYLIKDLSFTLKKGDKLAIIGEEGNGKSTLLKCLLGKCPYASLTGVVKTNHSIGYLKQSMSEEELEQKGFDFLFINMEDYYNKVSDFYRYLEELKLEDTFLEQTINTLSGGEKVKMCLLKLLLNQYDILFLDEPTNDLDIETLEWLEDFINKTDKPIIYVSHDETLLAHTANMILHIEQIKKKTECKHTVMRIDYETYVNRRLRSIEHQNQIAKSEKRAFQKQEERLKRVTQKVEHQQEHISRSDPHGARLLKKKMHALKAQEKKLENMELTETPDVEESIYFFFEETFVPKNKVILQLRLPKLMVGDSILAEELKLDIIGNTHLCIIGKNGIGKTTLIKKIYESLKTRNDIKVGYMPQRYEEFLDEEEFVLDFLASKNQDAITKARKYLGNLHFTRDEMEDKIGNLSNGTKAKLLLIKLVLDKCNVLILDEPTRNVSPLSNPVIRNVLREFKGTIISISHDRKYIEEVIDEVYLLNRDGLTKIR